MRQPAWASMAAAAFAFLVVGGSLTWWIRHRPAYLIYQAHRQMGRGNQPAVIVEYERLLKRRDLPKEEEIRLRRALAEFYLKAIEANDPMTISYNDDYEYIDPVSLSPKKVSYKVNQAADHPFLTSAKKECDRLLEINPKDPVAHLFTGWILWQKRLENFAIESLNASREYDPNDPRPLVFLSKIHERRGQHGLARDFALQAVSIQPEDNEARMALIEAYQHLGNFTGARREYENLSAAYREIPEVQARFALYLAEQNFWPESEREMERALQNGFQDGRVRLLYGQILLKKHAYDQAIAEFGRAMTLLPKNLWPLIWQSYAYSLNGQCDGIERMAQLFANRKRGFIEGLPWAHLVISWNYLCRGNASGALSELEEALKWAPEFQEALQLKTRILLDQGQYEDLGRVLRPLLDQNINQSFAYTMLAQSLLDQGNLALAEDMAETAIRHNARNPRPFLCLAVVRAERGDKEGALRAANGAISLNPNDCVLEAHRAYLLGLIGQFAASEDFFKASLGECPNEAEAWLLRGEIHQKQVNYPEAIQAFQNALQFKPYLLKAHLGLIASFAATKMTQAAEGALADAVKINSKHKEVAMWRRRFRKPL